MKQQLLAALIVGAAFLGGCASQPVASPTGRPAELVYNPSALPSGPVGDSIRYGRELVMNTRRHLKSYTTANMDCAACHVDGGTKAHGGSFVGIYGQFPQWNTRAKRVITLHDRLAECFLYSMNGRPPAYNSREMVALVAYIAYLSRGKSTGATPDPAVRIASFTPPAKPSVSRGARLYEQRCSACHAAGGEGTGPFPPLWGPKSFNSGAGMHQLGKMAGFVRYNMPQNAPGSLTDQEAYDVAAFVLSHARPKFRRDRFVLFPATQAAAF